MVRHHIRGLARITGFCLLTACYRVSWMGTDTYWPAIDCTLEVTP